MNIKNVVAKVGGRTLLKAKKYSPEILTAVGIVGVVGTVVLACKATLKVEDILDDTREKMDKIEDAILCGETESGEEYTDQDGKKDKTIVYVQTGLAFVKLYGPAVSLGVASVASILGGHNILKKRNVALVAAYKSVEEAFSQYRQRVVEDLGTEADENYRYGFEKVITEVEEDGVKVEKVVTTGDPNTKSMYARFFDESSKYWKNDAGDNLLYIKCQQNYWNDMLKSRGHVFLNEVYEALDIPHSQAGAVVGWVISKDGDNFIDFGIYDLWNEANRRFVNGMEPTILLDFNVNGIIYDLI